MSQSPPVADTIPVLYGDSPSPGVITFLDVLGWKGIYTREEKPIDRMRRLITGIKTDVALYVSNQIVVHSISDTIILYSKDVDPTTTDITTVVDAHGKVCANAIARSIIENIPVRGATAVGEFSVEDDIYVGKAIDEAAIWHEKADWIGVHLTPSAVYAVESLSPAIWKPYKPPLKEGMSISEIPCVVWTDAWKKILPFDEIPPRKQLRTIFYNMRPITPDFAMKYANTLAFFDKICDCEKDARQ